MSCCRFTSGLTAAAALLVGLAAGGGGPVLAAEPAGAGEQSAAPPQYELVRLRGKVLWLEEALRRRGIPSDTDAARQTAVLETAAGDLVPIVKDARGRAFHKDERLRNLPVELLVRRYAGSPYVQVVGLYAVKADGLYELDYWCDICSIPMYELKDCECCQGDTRLRERKVPLPKPSP